MTFSAQEATEYINQNLPEGRKTSYRMIRHFLNKGIKIKGTFKGNMWFVEKSECDRFIRHFDN